MKINVVGVSGSGKSTLARKLADALNAPYLEMDRLFWKPNWQEPTNEEFFPKLEQALKQDSWVLDGNFSRTNSIKWSEVDLVIWVDLPFCQTLFQAISRALRRVISQIELWPGTGNRESWGKLISKQSIVWWTIRHYQSNRDKYCRLMADPKYRHIRFIRLNSHKEAEALITQLVSIQQG
ncbi:shikimate kinase [Parendozoicomonas haliclonae]|uniref:Topology modulation protein n=1 Tax=Parendozoicomonas haliclonae TaxID=1960125 RepID=A0A1X7AQT9_9GAMM|nr:shikimate kinase [Parendozoicomonas haliclonae]SMA50681.1 topology modulation protein [Parendozoicomonas haliclonae]